MTDPKSTLRKRRTGGTSGGPRMPPEIAEWFAGRREMPVTALFHPYYDALPAWWREYAQRNPAARPPSDAPPALASIMFGQ
ncbi:hypothetical protein MOJ79_07130 [Calidifontimicrobium sp. SYSU G02091]|uniref:hypothetical protein n=1 Tax=Calidifontimicrobium sp. SYSU G02091 TaxID=2926421 RepID=UPI001F52E29D|nr:hypothetical protein [Calidifontimicrobium sp. SYSU G02091]MCI1191610.1 hypothetical protein [Calidifontimicrobium sp. SYSU G02091]